MDKNHIDAICGRFIEVWNGDKYIFGNATPNNVYPERIANWFAAQMEKVGRSHRSTKANDRYWAILRQASQETGYTAEELHEICKANFNKQTKEVFGAVYELVGSTSWMSGHEFSDYVGQVERWLMDNGIVLTNE